MKLVIKFQIILTKEREGPATLGFSFFRKKAIGPAPQCVKVLPCRGTGPVSVSNTI